MTTTMGADRNGAARRAGAWRGSGGFTLAEVLVALGLSGILLTAVLSALLFVARGGTRLMHFRDIETRAAVAVQQFAMDARQAKSVTWVNSNSLTMEVGDSGSVNYAYDSTKGTLTRVAPGGSSRVVASEISTFQFLAFNRDGAAVAAGAANINEKTKMVQLDILFKSRSRAVSVESDVISARYVLRNKTST